MKQTKTQKLNTRTFCT